MQSCRVSQYQMPGYNKCKVNGYVSLKFPVGHPIGKKYEYNGHVPIWKRIQFYFSVFVIISIKERNKS